MRPVPRRSMAFGWIGRSHKPRCLRKRSRTKISRKGLTDATAAPISSRRTPANWSRGKSARRVGALSLRRRRETGRPRALGPLLENKTIDGKLGQRAARLPNLEDQTSCDRGTLSSNGGRVARQVSESHLGVAKRATRELSDRDNRGSAAQVFFAWPAVCSRG